FSPGLNEKLVREAQTKKKQPAAPAKPSGAQLSEKQIADKVEQGVAQELARILEQTQLAAMQAKERQASTADLLNEIRDTTALLGERRGEKSPTFQSALAKRDAVAACLREKGGRTLDCWEEVGEFKQAVGELEREFVAGSK
ncbi:hypothetical protein EC988_005602, partial [Linderina pennispora]